MTDVDQVPDTIGRRERLIRARERAGFDSARAAAVRHGWPESTYRAHESGMRNFGLEDAERYGAAFGVPGRWIWEGGPEPHRELKHLPNVEPRRHIVTSPTRRLKVLGRAGASESGWLIMTSQTVDTVPCPPDLEDVPDAYAVFIVGDSMEPRFSAGEVVYVHPHRPYRRGHYVLVQIESANSHPHGFVKQFVTLTPTTLCVRQLNPDEEIEFPRKHVVSIHRIVGSSF